MLLIIFSSTALADNGDAAKSPDDIATALDTVWVLIAASLVFVMQAGFFLLEAGLTRAKNAANVVIKGAMDFCVGALVFWMIGFALMFGTDAGGFLGTSGFFTNMANPGWNGLPLYVFLLFQIAFAGAAATILSGAVSERIKFSAYLLVTICVTGFIYPVVGHWIWGEGGWLARIGMIDFAGSTVVHSVGGWSSLVGAWLLGARIGKYNKDGTPNAIPGHSLTLAALGTFILWLGWYGFNPGSTLQASPAIATIAMTTTLSASAGAVVSMLVTWLRYGKPDVSMAFNGALGGLVAITAGCANVSMTSALCIGVIAGALVVFSVEFIDRVLKVDDPVGAISVHGTCGAWGTIAVGLFAQASFGEANGVAAVNGLFYGGGLQQLGYQLLGVVSVMAWVFLTAGIVFLVIKRTIGLRVDDEGQRTGLDITEHNVEAYPDFQPVYSERGGR
ncbi:MAG: ammonium transporter [Actinomycetota bacterium]|nr:ammonium transporter [Actinomycetota bacterium]